MNILIISLVHKSDLFNYFKTSMSSEFETNFKMVLIKDAYFGVKNLVSALPVKVKKLNLPSDKYQNMVIFYLRATVSISDGITTMRIMKNTTFITTQVTSINSSHYRSIFY